MGFIQLNIIKGIFYLGQVVGGDAGIDFCGFDACVAEKFLNISQVDSLFKEGGGKAVTKGVRGGFFMDG